MSDITLPHPTFTDGNTLVADDVWENLYTTENTPNSFEVINGGLEAANVVAPITNSLITETIRPGSLSGGKGVGATANLDYFNNAFGDWVSNPNSNATGDVDSFYQPIPGAAVSFYLPYAADSLFLHWRIRVLTAQTTSAGDHLSIIRLFVDNTRIDAVYQELPKLPTVGGAFSTHQLVGREWAGHYLKTSGLSKGWHSASLRIAVDNETTSHVRAQVRNFNYVYFR
tara:strand:+ start:327 stop:1007 length:681 start_codon:yes stop_codon:yes gene_type:complete